ncbi:MAG TPA: DUF2905 domain-containing protein [Chthonomonadales bacterium]|nr:DUF2905 domain-containing protein [Chthonomonadales bacterium]
MTDVGRTLVFLGILLVLVGLGIMFWSRLGLPRLPGDILIQRGSFSFYFPLMTSLILSIVLTILLNLIIRRR